MSLRERRIISAMTPEAEAKMARMEAEGLDPITGKPLCEGVNCRCEIKHGKRGAKGGGETGQKNGGVTGDTGGGV